MVDFFQDAKSVTYISPERALSERKGWSSQYSPIGKAFFASGSKIFSIVAFIPLVLYAPELSGQDLKIPQKPIHVNYIANEGVLISAGADKVLIDGLFREGVSGYGTIPDDVLKKLESAQPPYHDIDLVLNTHIHADHFDPVSVGLHLRNNPKTELVAGPDVVKLLESSPGDYAELEDQLSVIVTKWKESVELSPNGIRLKALHMRHGYHRNYGLHHLGYLVEIGGQKLLHIGDLEIIEENFKPFDLVKENIDLAFLPFWMLIAEPGIGFVKTLIKPRQIIAIHVPPRDAEKVAADVKRYFPQAVVFTRSLEQHEF